MSIKPVAAFVGGLGSWLIALGGLAWGAPPLGPHRVVVDPAVRVKMRDGVSPRGGRVSARRAGEVPRAVAADTLQPRGARHRAAPGVARLRGGPAGHPRPLRLGGHLLSLPRRRARRLRHGGVGGGPARGRREGRHVRRLLRGRHADARRLHEAPAPRGHLPLRHRVRVLRELDLPVGRPHAVVRLDLGLAPRRGHGAQGRGRSGRTGPTGRRPCPSTSSASSTSPLRRSSHPTTATGCSTRRKTPIGAR